jgi:aspartyl-tRNA synthetase
MLAHVLSAVAAEHRTAIEEHFKAEVTVPRKGLEITTGAQREHRYDALLAQAAEKGLSPEPMRWYLDCFRYGCPPHGGFGLGLGRLLMVLLDLGSIRDATFLFRGPNRLVP